MDLEQRTDLDKLEIKFDLQQECLNTSQNENNDLSTSLTVSFKYRTDIALTTINNEVKQEIYDKEEFKFTQLVNVVNQGPSPSAETVEFKIYKPSSSLVMVKVIQFDNFTCVEGRTGRIGSITPTPESAFLVSCENDNCGVEDCTLNRVIQRGESVPIAISLTFNTQEAVRDIDNDRYMVRTHASGPGSTPRSEFLELSTQVTRKGAPEAQKGFKKEKLVIGAGIGILVMLAVVIVLWKSGILGKMRIYRKKLDDAQNTEAKTSS